MSTEVKMNPSPADITAKDTSIVPKFESILNRNGLSTEPGDLSGCVQCQTCVRCCIGCNLIPEGSQPDDLVNAKLHVGDIRGT